MQLSPALSKRIRDLILKQGLTRSTFYITVSSVALSVAIAKIIAILMPGNSGDFNLGIAVLVPLLVAPLFAYTFLSLYFELEKVREEINTLAVTDELTRVYNRRQFMRLAELELERSKRNRRAISVIIFDIDDFKNINDRHGHLCGDVVLQELSQACQKILRPYDAFARFGGEEFILLLPETDEANALQVANRLCQFVSAHVVDYKGTPIRVTISIGVTTSDVIRDTLDDLLRRADQALYRAKGSGKNRLEVGRLHPLSA